MKTIRPAANELTALLWERHPESVKDARLSRYALEADCPEGTLLYHTLTGELLLLVPGESADDPALREELARRRFLVPSSLEEKTLCDQTRELLRLLHEDDGTVTNYIIFTTTDCNARCYYCFEQGQRRLSMTEETARDVAAWMLAHSGGRPIRIRWFGGEPLVNVKVIDRISETLREHGADYSATMFSNSYLFTPEIVRRAASLWQLRHVTVTLDGTEEVYNRTKAYAAARESAFPRVLDNLERLLDAGISVTVNLGMDGENADDLFSLAEQLGERFGGCKGFAARVALLQEYVSPIRAFESRERAVARKRELNERLSALKIRGKRRLGKGVKLNCCMADDPHSVTVLPDGRLGRCEHFGDREEVGSIYADSLDTEALHRWCELRPEQDECARCFYYPRCLRLKKCPDNPAQCDAWTREQLRERVQHEMRCAWEHWKQRNCSEIT